ncbi:Ctr copper transporter family-domain-containing protein [Podospora fimiseda]|uniref:Copper transport protein n=1 Tax=Podospora fimiseda TaxID=252190 RepID=A0AAN7BHG7_9PEZI|nr:Ctr copper transporter family-domain-containing protein [Podospora fimiseda]
MDHDHGAMAADIVTSTTSAIVAGVTAMANSTTAASGGGMGGMGGHGCKISMLWNWNTIGSCFIASSWKITSNSVFAGSCIGVLLLTMSLEALRRAVKEWDRYLIKKHLKELQEAAAHHGHHGHGTAKGSGSDDGSEKGPNAPTPAAGACPRSGATMGYRPNIWEQAVRALLHLFQFAVAYFVMLLAMYYNGYIIICIFIGAYLGSFIFHWEPLGVGQSTSATQEATVCCG